MIAGSVEEVMVVHSCQHCGAGVPEIFSCRRMITDGTCLWFLFAQMIDRDMQQETIH